MIRCNIDTLKQNKTIRLPGLSVSPTRNAQALKLQYRRIGTWKQSETSQYEREKKHKTHHKLPSEYDDVEQ